MKVGGRWTRACEGWRFTIAVGWKVGEKNKNEWLRLCLAGHGLWTISSREKRHMGSDA